MFIRRIKWIIGSLIGISSLGLYISIQNLQESRETVSPQLIQRSNKDTVVKKAPRGTGDTVVKKAPHATGDTVVKKAPRATGDTVVKKAPHATGVKRHGKVTIPGHINVTYYRTNVDRLLSLQAECNATSEETYQTLTDGWPKPSYFFSDETNIKYCPLGQTKLPFWTFVFKTLLEKTSDSTQEKFNVEKIEFGQRKAALAKTVFMVRNPYSRLLSGYIDKYLLGVDICKETSLQMFLDHLIVGMRLKINLAVALMPMYAMCRPCNYNTFAVVTYEDFENDIEYALTAVGAKKWKNTLMKNQRRLMQVDESIKTLTNIAVRNYKTRDCKDMNMLGGRLAEAFYLKGYISSIEHSLFDFQSLGMNIEETEESIQKMVQQGLLSKTMNTTVRDQALREAFSGVNNHTMQQIVSTYKFEFDTFGYNTEP